MQDIALDQFSGRMKAPAIAINPPEPKKKVAPKGRQEPVIQHAPHLPKPQHKFKRRVDNTNDVVWSPTLRHKFNARVPLGYIFDPESRGGSDKEMCVWLTLDDLSVLMRQVDLRTPTSTKSTTYLIRLTCFNRKLQSPLSHLRKPLSLGYQHVRSSTFSLTSSAGARKSRSTWNIIVTAHTVALYVSCRSVPATRTG